MLPNREVIAPEHEEFDRRKLGNDLASCYHNKLYVQNSYNLLSRSGKSVSRRGSAHVLLPLTLTGADGVKQAQGIQEEEDNVTQEFSP